MPKKAKVRMYSRKSVNVPIQSEEEISIKSMFDLFLTEKSIEGLSERTINDYIIHFDYLMDFFGGRNSEYTI